MAGRRIYAQLFVGYSPSIPADEYLDRISTVKHHKLILSSNSISMIENGVETIVKWSAFSKLVIEKNHLSLWGSENFVFPKKSMSEDDYSLLTEIARSQIKHGL